MNNLYLNVYVIVSVMDYYHYKIRDNSFQKMRGGGNVICINMDLWTYDLRTYLNRQTYHSLVNTPSYPFKHKKVCANYFIYFMP